MRDVKRQEIATELVCEKCGKPMVIKWGRMGEFLACSGYPECRNTMNFRREDGKVVPEKEEEIPTDEKCPTCGARHGDEARPLREVPRLHRATRSARARSRSRSASPARRAAAATSREKRSKRGKTFYGCSSYPNCDFVAWDRPRNEACPQCGSAYLLDKYSKKTGAVHRLPEQGVRLPPRGGGEAAPRPGRA